MAKEPNLKVNVTADTSKFSKGMKDSKAALRDFKRTGEEALGKIGDAAGVNVGKLTQVSNAVKGLGTKLSQSGTAGVAAFGKIVAAAGGAATAVAGIGIAGLVAAFKLLSEEADHFKRTIEGANMELANTAYIDTYKAAMADLNMAIGESLTEVGNSFERGWKTRIANVKANLITFANLFKQTPNAGSLFSKAYVAANLTDVVVPAAKQNAQEAAERAAELQKELNDLVNKERNSRVTIAKLDADIATNRERMRDTDLSVSERRAALQKAEELIRQKYELQYGIQKRIAEIMNEMVNLTSSSQEEVDRAIDAEVKAFNLEQSMHNELAALLRTQRSLTNEAKAEATAREKAAAAAKAIADDRAELSGMNLQAIDQGRAQSMMGGNQVSSDQATGITNLQVEDVAAVNREIIDLSESINTTLSDAVISAAEVIGELCADLATGQDAWGNFKNAALSAFGSMAVNVGKIALATGIAILGIKQGLMSLNPYVAIAAGAALIALGIAVKVGLANVASGSTSSGTASIASATNQSGSSNTNQYETNEVEVRVTGTLQASGTQLLAIINNENKRTNHTT